MPPCPPGQPPGDPPKVRHQSSSRCDSMSVQSFQMSTECHHLDTVAPPADFVTTYNPVSITESSTRNKLTFTSIWLWYFMASNRRALRKCSSQVSECSVLVSHFVFVPWVYNYHWTFWKYTDKLQWHCGIHFTTFYLFYSSSINKEFSYLDLSRFNKMGKRNLSLLVK